MPVASSDCCGTCEFNTISQSEGRTPPGDQDRAFFCQIRQVPIDNPFWTFCHNHQRRNPLLSRTPRGPIWATVSNVLRQMPLAEDLYIPPEAAPPADVDSSRYARVPYFGGTRPLDSDQGRCEVCGEEVSRTIALRFPATQERLCFCSVAHYLQWWLQTAPEAQPYRNRRPISSDVLYGDLLLLVEELVRVETQLLTALDKSRLLDVLRGLEGALVQANNGYLDLARAGRYLREREAGGKPSSHLLRAWLKMAQISEAMHEEAPNRQLVRSAVRDMREALDRFLASVPGQEERPRRSRKWWEFWR